MKPVSDIQYPVRSMGPPGLSGPVMVGSSPPGSLGLGGCALPSIVPGVLEPSTVLLPVMLHPSSLIFHDSVPLAPLASTQEPSRLLPLTMPVSVPAPAVPPRLL